MLLKRFYDDKLAQASYLVGCAATGEALVIDANRDVDQYLRAAEGEGVQITHVTETHIHADFVSGARELARRTGATLLLSDEAEAAARKAATSAPAPWAAYRLLVRVATIDSVSARVLSTSRAKAGICWMSGIPKKPTSADIRIVPMRSATTTRAPSRR